MNFSGFFENPVEFIQEWIQNDEVSGSSDFLIDENIKTAFQLNPRLIKHIPLVNSLSDVQKTPPGKLVRIRCVMRNDIGKIIIPNVFRILNAAHGTLSANGPGCICNRSRFARSFILARWILRSLTQWHPLCVC